MKQSLYWRLLLILAMAGTLVLASCGDDPITTDGPGHSASGFVTDSVTGTSIDSARIYTGDTILGAFWYSDSTGYYIVPSWGSRITIFVQKTGYGTKSRVVELTGDPTDVDFELVPIP